MANEEQVKILKQGVDVWNQWRERNRELKIDLSGAECAESDFNKINLIDANFSRAKLNRASLENAILFNAEFSKADLSNANLFGADLTKANLTEANLTNANIINANLFLTDFSWAILKEANLEKANLGYTIFAETDLSNTKGLAQVKHGYSSTIGTNTIQRSKGNIPLEFLRGCGLSDIDIEYSKLYDPNLSNEKINKIVYRIYDLRATQSIQISPLFISYSHADKLFVDKIDIALTEKGVRFWRDIHDATAGRLETQIDRAIRQNPTVLLVLSKNSIKSDWVEHEVRKARELEKELGRDALCPIALDDAWKSSPWPKRVMEQVMEYNILDFSDWEDKSAFEGKFAKLLNGLDLFYKKAEA